MFRKIPLLTKVLLTIFLGTSIPLVVFNFHSFCQYKDRLTEEEKLNQKTINKVLLQLLENGLWNYAQTETQNDVTRFLEYPEISHIIVLDSEAREFASSHQNVGYELPSQEFNISHENTLIGSFKIIFNESRIAKNMNAYLNEIILDSFIVIALILFSTYSLLRFTVMNRLSRIFKATETLAQRKFEVNYDWPKGDEIDQLGNNLETARLDLKMAFISLKQQNSELESRVAEKTQQLLESAKMSSLGEMSSGIAHEINNPLTIISGKLLLMNKELDRDKKNSEDLTKSFVIINKSVDRIVKIINGLKQFSRNGNSDEFEKVALDTIMEDTLGFCMERFKVNKVDIEVSIQKDLEINCRPSQISQVLLNLLNNAFDAIQALPTRWIKIEGKKIDDSLELSVTDSGSPPIEIAHKLMEPFFTTKEPGKGTGLGLSISKGIIGNHGGSFYLDRSSPHTKFCIKLPLNFEKNLKQVA